MTPPNWRGPPWLRRPLRLVWEPRRRYCAQYKACTLAYGPFLDCPCEEMQGLLIFACGLLHHVWWQLRSWRALVPSGVREIIAHVLLIKARLAVSSSVPLQRPETR